ncbi:MAG: NADPH-dependent 7-cyano-7-deazaguanine reductase [Gammaproteobacteria bacterium]|uniref:NADPH-dependent 7-cyano-7-deazaguanine reductase n=1 Tax=Rhodoferax sp. TaxID=50421 RepID=UPI0017EB01DE|nr:NADPH-dependent 7-cyano-7-deazaguanine reductase [Rhodoferax sp.]MBU3899663.1 NADPH-dependent 7-cyano-7-deazaguanine reductase [Gammaproteobacteria bacterium]MBA3056372.1 NADPH-dependent 7-cyano-7-deazaguanine reductase QueF [Rhodoferax sp.]MBU3997415.1 NADPH-dependent 7-cyano-7-deazaguanine reductase [Gammaproteobacteria bacterium]MBU4018139.1 NADPH-dependent 7-cyano-7-deazaguanine reductase [Gammaproteobacteria bacterium]MBU4080170.1 NADPH-dependent 7-cyano-7-deazaguanine reductase [Gamma
MTTPQHSPLGQATVYLDQYDAALLFPIARAAKRVELGIQGALPFLGADMWSAFELSWLNLRGKPQVALARFTVPCESPNIIESKSFKLYLNSFNNTRFVDADAVKARLRADLSEAVWRDLQKDVVLSAVAPAPGAGAKAPPSIGVTLLLPELFDREPIYELDGLSLDRLDIECSHTTPAPELLRVVPGEAPVSEVLVSNLLKSNCPVTGQPDWASVQISYSGAPIDQERLLQYLVSFRNHNEFHEQCVERIFMDLWTRCKPTRLAVYARYTRRGGLDINPFRTSYAQALPANTRMARQ